jgi:hypothetical protein
MKLRKLNILAAAAFFAVVFQPGSLSACAACYGASDSPMAKGMNWGIVSLLGVVAVVLGSVASFFVFLGKRSAAISAQQEKPATQKPEPTEKV